MKDAVDPICHLLSNSCNICHQFSNRKLPIDHPMLSIDHPMMTKVFGASSDPIPMTYRRDHWLVALKLLDEQFEQVQHLVLGPVSRPSVEDDPIVG